MKSNYYRHHYRGCIRNTGKTDIALGKISTLREKIITWAIAKMKVRKAIMLWITIAADS